MTNLEKIKGMSASSLCESAKLAASNPLKSYIDYPAWLDSDDPKCESFVRTEGICIMTPSDVQVTYAGCKSEQEKKEYIAKNSKPMLILDGDYRIYNTPHIIRLTDLNFSVLVSVSEYNVTVIDTKPRYAKDALLEIKRRGL